MAYSRTAQERGADGVLTMPTYVRHSEKEGIFAFLQAVSEAISIPVMVQNEMAPLGTSMSIKLVARMAQDIQGVRYVKEGVRPPGPRI